jgi:hypothetical protein
MPTKTPPCAQASSSSKHQDHVHFSFSVAKGIYPFRWQLCPMFLHENSTHTGSVIFYWLPERFMECLVINRLCREHTCVKCASRNSTHVPRGHLAVPLHSGFGPVNPKGPRVLNLGSCINLVSDMEWLQLLQLSKGFLIKSCSEESMLQQPMASSLHWVPVLKPYTVILTGWFELHEKQKRVTHALQDAATPSAIQLTLLHLLHLPRPRLGVTGIYRSPLWQWPF